MARFNHWLGALLILAALALGLIFPDLPRGTGKTFLRTLHIAIGTTLLPLMAWRLLWRASVPSPLPYNRTPFWQWLTRLSHLGLLACLLTMLVSGVLMQWWGGRQIGVFNLLRIDSPLAPSELWHERMALCHASAAWLLIGLLILHLLGLLFHTLRQGGAAWGRMGGRARR